jgi:hypothetical protein
LQTLLTDKKIKHAMTQRRNTTRTSSNVSELSFRSRNDSGRSRRYSNKINLFLSNLKSQTICRHKIENFENSINEGIEIIEEDLENQQMAFHAKRSRRVRKSSIANSIGRTPRTSSKNVNRKSSNFSISFLANTPRPSKIAAKTFIINQNDKFYPVIQNFIRQFQILYFHSIFEKAIDFTKNSCGEICSKKIDKFNAYEVDIKNFQLFSLMEEGKKGI